MLVYGLRKLPPCPPGLILAGVFILLFVIWVFLVPSIGSVQRKRFEDPRSELYNQMLSRVVTITSSVSAGCGGVVVDPSGTIVLSSAHCFLKKDYTYDTQSVKVNGHWVRDVVVLASLSDENKRDTRLGYKLAPDKDLAVVYMHDGLALGMYGSWLTLYPYALSDGCELSHFRGTQRRALEFINYDKVSGEMRVNSRILHNTASDYGDSGSPVFDNFGLLAGIMSAKCDESGKEGLCVSGQQIKVGLEEIAPKVVAMMLGKPSEK